MKVNRYLKTEAIGDFLNAGGHAGEYFDAEFLLVDRILAHRCHDSGVTDDAGGTGVTDDTAAMDTSEDVNMNTSDVCNVASGPVENDGDTDMTPTNSAKIGDTGVIADGTDHKECDAGDTDLKADDTGTGFVMDGDERLELEKLEFLVKWKNLTLEESTWEPASVCSEKQISHYFRYRRAPPELTGRRQPRGWQQSKSSRSGRPKKFDPKSWQAPAFPAGRELRSYQVEGVKWLCYNWHQRRNCILADEMG
eukprot:567285_1